MYLVAHRKTLKTHYTVLPISIIVLINKPTDIQDKVKHKKFKEAQDLHTNTVKHLTELHNFNDLSFDLDFCFG